MTSSSAGSHLDEHVQRFHAGPKYGLAFAYAPPLTTASIAQTIAGVIVHDLVAAPQGGFQVLQLDRPSHEDALSEIEGALAQLGFDIAQAVVVQWATPVVEGIVIGGLAGGGAFASAARDAEATSLGAFVGALAGLFVGSFVQKAVAAYQARRLDPFAGGWQLTQSELPAAPRLSWGLGLHAA